MRFLGDAVMTWHGLAITLEVPYDRLEYGDRRNEMSRFLKKIGNDFSLLFLAIVMLGSMASLILFLLFSDVCTHEIECISDFLDKIELSADGVITATIAIIGTYYVYLQIRQKNNNFRLNKFESRVRSVSNNIRFHDVKEGYLEFIGNSSYRFVAAWKLNERSLTILIRPIRNDSEANTIRKKLLDVENRERWSSRFTIFFNKEEYGEIVQSNINENSIEKFDDYDYPCVGNALLYLQQIDRDEMFECQRLLHNTRIKNANDIYLSVPIFDRPAVFHKI